jgi:fumarate hydratase class I
MLGIGIGGTAEKAAVLAKEALMEPVDIQDLLAKGAETGEEKLRLELYEKVNKLGIGAQGLGGLTTVVDVKIKSAPTHAASMPVVMIPNCAATRHAHFTLDGSGPAYLEPPKLSEWPQVNWTPDASAIRVDLDTLTPEIVQGWKQGDRLLLNGKMLTGRDAAHKRIKDMLDRGEPLPVDFAGRVIYYVGPVDPVGDEVVGPAGPTTATRMDKFTRMMLGQGLLAMVGKAERGPDATQAIAEGKSAYLMAVGGAFLTLSAFSSFFFEMVNGRGWVCVALVVFGAWKPGKAVLGAILFAGFDALQIRLQQTDLGAVLPYQLFLAAPYILSILALILMSRRAEVPAALMVPYNKGER